MRVLRLVMLPSKRLVTKSRLAFTVIARRDCFVVPQRNDARRSNLLERRDISKKVCGKGRSLLRWSRFKLVLLMLLVAAPPRNDGLLMGVLGLACRLRWWFCVWRC
jgi:hypothetical protein